jgi:hypothetical protein
MCVEGIWLHSFLTSALRDGEWLASRRGRFTPKNKPWHSTDKTLGEVQSTSGRSGEEEHPALRGIEPNVTQSAT